jgi:glucosyl-3-phosphoglycerate synthase
MTDSTLSFWSLVSEVFERLFERFSKPFVTAVIPAHNEESTIKKVIRVIKGSDADEIIVVSDGSSDRTASIARKEGVKVISHKKNLGKGAAMKTGVDNARGNIIVFLDADLKSLTPKQVNMLISPVKNNKVDFVKSYYSHYKSKTGTSFFLYRPLLRKLFEGADFTHPVSGQICGRRSFFDRIEFRNDYGIDISILIDAISHKLKIEEICLGKLIHRQRDVVQVEKIADEVILAILEKSGYLMKND